VRDQRGDGGGDHSWRNHRLVSLNHHYYIGFESCGRLGDAIAGPFMSSRRHNDRCAESFGDAPNLLIAGRYVHRVEEVTHHGPANHMLDHRTTEKGRKWLARKTGRTHPRWNNCDDCSHVPPQRMSDKIMVFDNYWR